MSPAANSRIAIVEDDPDLRGYLATIIGRAQGMEVVHATHSLSEAIETQEAGSVDLWLVDINLPDGSGLDLVEKIASCPSTRAMVLTVLGDKETVLQAFRCGADGYVLKDSAPDQLKRSIEATLAGETPISARAAKYLLQIVRENSGSADRRSPVEESPLTGREIQILKLFSKGLTYREAAGMLGISQHTVGDHIKAIYAKLSVHSRAEALFEARQLGLLSPGD